MNGSPTKIANVMLGRGKNGIKQAFLDYNKALTLAGFSPVPIISRGAAVEAELRQTGRSHHAIRQWGAWDIAAARTLSHIFREQKVAAVIAHGNRALALAWRAAGAATPVIAVAHNYRTARFKDADAVIAVASDLESYLARQLGDTSRLFHVPNSVPSVSPMPQATAFRSPPVIGAMGRMEKKKGFDVLCAALAMLKSNGASFKAVIAGDGEERAALEQTVRMLGLGGDVTLMGWVDDKTSFWPNIDIFCLPSLHEPFGIVLLEAWAAGKPVVTTDTEGPGSIASHDEDALIVPKDDAAALARSIEALLKNPARAHALAVKGQHKVRAHYTIETAADALRDALTKILT